MSKTKSEYLNGGLTKYRAFLCAALFLGVANITEAAIFTGNVSTLWSVEGNWDPIGVPGATAEIPPGKVVDLNVAASVTTLITQPGSLIRASGGSLTVTGTFDCKGGQMGSAATPFQLNIAPNATMNVAASNAHRWDAVVINNAGKFDWAGGDLRCSAQINNTGMMVFHGDGFFGETGIGGLIVNSGRIIKESGAGITSLYGFNGNDYRLMRINNTTGSIAVADGTLEIGAGDMTGDFEVGPQHTLRIKGGPANLKDVAMTGGGTVEINNALGGDIRLIGIIDVDVELKVVTNVTAGDGAAQNQATLRGGGKLTWESGNLLGEFILGSDFRTVITGGAGRGASNLTNRGTMSWVGPGPVGGLLQNEGTWNLLAPGTFTGYAQNCNIQNRGTINTFGGGTNTSDAGTFVNAGLLNIGGYGKAGILNVYAGFQQTPTGSLYMEIGGANPATPEFDQLLSFAPEAIDGKLTVAVINNFNPPTDARFRLINTQTGTFSKAQLPGLNRFKIEYPGNNKTEIVSLSEVPIPALLWTAGRDLLRNESPDNATESESVNHTVPEWTYRYQVPGQPSALFTPQQHINDGSGLHGWIGPGGATLGVNTKNTPIIFDSGSGNYKPLLPTQIYMSPGSNGETVSARWTAPATGNYRVLARWVDLDDHGGDGVKAYIFRNGEFEFSTPVESTPTMVRRGRMRAQDYTFNAGEYLEFTFAVQLDKMFDATAFNAAIRRIPKVSITSPASGTQLNGGEQDVTINVNVEETGPMAGVMLNVDGAQNVARDSTAPYSPTVRLKPGPHKITAVAVDADGAQVESAAIAVIVAPPAAQQALEKRPDSPNAAAASPVGKLFYSSQSGLWNDPATWGNQGGVPLRWDFAIIQPGHHVMLDVELEVRDVTVNGTLSTDPSQPVQHGIFVYGTLEASGRIENIDLFINGPAGKFVVLNPGPVLRSVNIINQSSCVIRTNQFDAENVTLDNRGSIKAGPPITSQGPLALPFAGFTQTSGATTLDVNTSLSVPPGAKIGGQLLLSPGYLVGLDGASIITHDGASIITHDGASIITHDGASLVGLDGGSVVARDGAGVVSTDGSGVISDAGAGLVGLDGSSLVGPDGLRLVGNDGGSLISRPGPPAFQSRSPATPAATPGDLTFTGGTVTGTGELRANVINQGAVIAPGNSAGGLVVMGDYTQQAGGTLVLEKGGKTFEPFTYDVFEVSGNASLGGNLVVKTIDGYTPTSGDSVAPLLYGSHTGNFASVTSNAQITLGPKAGTVDVTGENPPTPKALNIATRMKVETGDNALIAGFIITGSQPKKVIIRGIGPSLPFAGVLADPTLSLDNGAITNNNWRDTQEQEIIATTIPPSNNLEAAIVATLNPGGHTAVLRGNGNATGIGVVEVYDLESGSPVQLANISSRGLVQAGDNVMIGGFIIGGNYSPKVIVRAIGPSLTVAGKLADPTLELVDQNGGRISNDNWRETQEAEIIATTIPPSHDNESAIVANLAPGAYTAIVRGKDDTTGIAVVEAYNLQ